MSFDQHLRKSSIDGLISYQKGRNIIYSWVLFVQCIFRTFGGYIRIMLANEWTEITVLRTLSTFTQIWLLRSMRVPSGVIKFHELMEVLVGKSPVNDPFSIAMIDYRRVDHFY